MSHARNAPSWAVDGRDWPNRSHSRFVLSGGLTWHVQEMGEGPVMLLLHGTGASTHSFRDLAPALAGKFRIVMVDLPGHGFTQMPSSAGLSLKGMARLVSGLLKTLDVGPEVVVGHSAGAAILIAMALDGMIAPKAIIAINGALRPIAGAHVFSPLAKLLFINPLVPKLFSWRAGDARSVGRLLEGTGSTIDAVGIELYARLFRKSGHVAATLGMMANWDLDWLQSRLPSLEQPLILLAAARDRAVPPADAALVARRARHARVFPVVSGGHLVHEEHPQEIADLLIALAQEFHVTA